MSPYFNEPDRVSLFAEGFDLILDGLSDFRIIYVITEIESEMDEYSEDTDAIFSLDALYDAIGDPDGAIGALSRYANIDRHSLFLLRKARHLEQKGEKTEADQLLQTIIQRAAEKLNAWDFTSQIRQLCALLAYGRRGDQQSFTELWYRLLKEYDLMEPVPEEDILEYPGNYSFFEILPHKEHIEGIGYLIRFDIHKGREAAMISLVLTIRNFLDFMLEDITKDIPDYLFDDYIMVFPVIRAIAKGGTRIVEEIYSREGVVTSQAESDAMHRALGVIQEIDRKVAVMDTLIRWSSELEEPAPEKINQLREQSGGNDDLIAIVAGNPGFGLPIMIIDELLLGIIVSFENRSRLLNRKLSLLEGEHRYNDAIALINQHPEIELEDGEYEDLNFKALVESHKEREAFDYLRGQMENGHLLDQRAKLFELALSLEKIDEILLYKPLFETLEIKEGVFLLNAYEQMIKKDMKRGLEYIEQAKRAGISEDMALIFTARFLLLSGFPKRVVGLTEKMIKRKIPAQHVYPLLIQAYCDLGRKQDAKKAEAAYKRVGQQVPGSVRKW